MAGSLFLLSTHLACRQGITHFENIFSHLLFYRKSFIGITNGVSHPPGDFKYSLVDNEDEFSNNGNIS